MTFQKVERPVYRSYPNSNKGDVLVEGRYLYSKEGKFGIQHFFEQQDAQIVGLNSTGMLDKFVENSLWEGRAVKIVFGGKQAIEKGAYAGKEANTFDFYIDPDEKKTGMTKVTNPDELD